MSDDNEVGHGKAPKWTRFKPGQSGNPNGRPRRSPEPLSAIILNTITAPVAFREKGRKRKVPQYELTLKAAIEDAKTGDLDAAAFVLQAIKAAKRAGTLGPGVIRIIDWLPALHDVVEAPADAGESHEGSDP